MSAQKVSNSPYTVNTTDRASEHSVIMLLATCFITNKSERLLFLLLFGIIRVFVYNLFNRVIVFPNGQRNRI